MISHIIPQSVKSPINAENRNFAILHTIPPRRRVRSPPTINIRVYWEVADTASVIDSGRSPFEAAMISPIITNPTTIYTIWRVKLSFASLSFTPDTGFVQSFLPKEPLEL